MLKVRNSVKFKKDLKKFEHQQKVLDELNDVLELLVKELPLDKKIETIRSVEIGLEEESVT